MLGTITKKKTELAASPIVRLRGQMDDIFGRFFGLDWPWDGGQGGFWPELDVTDNLDSVVVKADLPGMKSEETLKREQQRPRLRLAPGLMPDLSKTTLKSAKMAGFFLAQNKPRKGQRPNLMLTRCLPRSVFWRRPGMTIAYYISVVGVFFCAPRAGLIEARCWSLTCEE
jgi:hypothetical protein